VISSHEGIYLCLYGPFCELHPKIKQEMSYVHYFIHVISLLKSCCHIVGYTIKCSSIWWCQDILFTIKSFRELLFGEPLHHSIKHLNLRNFLHDIRFMYQMTCIQTGSGKCTQSCISKHYYIISSLNIYFGYKRCAIFSTICAWENGSRIP
jgi:hypothetical protein